MIYFGLTPAKYHGYLDKYKDLVFCHNLNETELKLCHFFTVLKLHIKTQSGSKVEDHLKNGLEHAIY